MVVDEFEDVEVLFRDGTRVEEAARKTTHPDPAQPSPTRFPLAKCSAHIF